MRDYRPDIDGLRALAVIAVVFFHAELLPFRGGYVGVDVFFVISGFLISRIILSEMRQGRFSLLHFYERRARRILPAFLAVAMATAIVGAVVMAPRDVERLGQSLLSALLFGSNVYFWQTFGYFDTIGLDRPLLHTWSLSVEEQFYILYPLLMIWAARDLERRVRLLLVIFIASLGGSILLLEARPTATFYLAPLRAWELLLGAALVVLPVPAVDRKGVLNLIGFAGAVLIIGPILAFDKTTPFPGLAAVPPTLGTLMLIYSGASAATWTQRALGWTPLVALGKCSYSLYLWHFPIFCFARYIWFIGPNGRQMLALVAVSVTLAFLSRQWIELPFLSRDRIARPVFVPALGIATALLLATGAILAASPEAVELALGRSQQANAAASVSRAVNSQCDYAVDRPRACEIGDRLAPALQFAIWGDSHCVALTDTIDEVARQVGKRGLYGCYPGCPPLVGLDRRPRPDQVRDCSAFNEAFMARLLSEPGIEHVVMVSAWHWSIDGAGGLFRNASRAASSNAENPELFSESLAGAVRALARSGKKVIVVLQAPASQYDIPRAVKLQELGILRSVDISPRPLETAQLTAIFEEIGQIENVSIFDPSSALCHAGQCPHFGDGKLLYTDGNHLSRDGSRMLGPTLAATIWR